MNLPQTLADGEAVSPFDLFTVEIADHVALVTMNRPDKLNAMNHQFFTEIKDCFLSLSERTDVRAIVLAANGKHFTAGLDLMESANIFADQSGDAARVREKFRRHVLWLQSTFNVIEECPVPVIAAIHGACVGGGVDLVSACDIRIAADDSFFSIKEVDVGMVADLGTLQRMPKLMPMGIVKELAFTGRKMPAKEAQGHGFVNFLEADREAVVARAMTLAAEIAGKSPLAVTGIKSVLNHARDNAVYDGLDYVATWNSGMLIGEDVMKAASATMTKQAVAFADRLPSDE